MMPFFSYVSSTFTCDVQDQNESFSQCNFRHLGKPHADDWGWSKNFNFEPPEVLQTSVTEVYKKSKIIHRSASCGFGRLGCRHFYVSVFKFQNKTATFCGSCQRHVFENKREKINMWIKKIKRWYFWFCCIFCYLCFPNLPPTLPKMQRACSLKCYKLYFFKCAW